MQRRAAAAYLALFLVIGAGAYAYTGVAEKPHVDIDAPEYQTGDEIPVNGTTYTVNTIAETGGGAIVGNLSWTEPEATYTASLENNSTVSWQTISWDSQPIETATLSDGSTLQYNGSTYEVVLNATASPPTVRLQQESNASINETYERGGTITLRLDDQLILGATLTEVTDSQATMSWGDNYHVSIANVSDPSSVTLTQDFNVTRRLRTDTTYLNDTVTSEGQEYVLYRVNDSRLPLEEYLPEPVTQEYSEGDTVQYDGNATTVGNITVEEAPLTWTGPEDQLTDISEGASVQLGGQPYFVHFSSSDSVQLLANGSASDNWETYQSQNDLIDAYNGRMAGLWGVVILSFFAAFILATAAYLPVKD